MRRFLHIFTATLAVGLFHGEVLRPSVALAQAEEGTIPTNQELHEALHEQAELIRQLQQRLHPQSDSFALQPMSSASDATVSCTPEMIRRTPLVAEVSALSQGDSAECDPPFLKLNYYIDYDQGWTVRPFDQQKSAFDVKLNGWIQFRHHGFVRQSDTWTDNAGIVRPISNRKDFDIERARLTLRGHAIDPRLSYFLQLDGDTDDGHRVDFFDYWWGWQCTDRLQIQLGKRKVPASRQWLLGARRTRFVDRPMADDFFRPDRTVGVFAVGSFARRGHYALMVGEGYRTANLPNAATDNRFAFAGTSYIDPAGDFGGQIIDFANSTMPLWRLGHSVAYSPQTSDERGTPL